MSAVQALVRSKAWAAFWRQAQSATGAVVSTTVTFWLQKDELPQSSTASQVRVMTQGQVPLVTVLMETATPLDGVPDAGMQALVHEGGSKLHGLPHSTVLFEAQMSVNLQAGRAVTTKFTEQEAALEEQS